VLALAAPRLGNLPRYVSALLLGVVIFESLRPREKRVVIETPAPAEAAPVLAPPADTSEADAHIARLKSDIEDLVEINDALRQQSERGESSVKQLNDELAKLRAQMATEADAGRAREKKIRDQYEAESEHVQRAAAKAMEEIQRNRASNDEFRTRAEKVGAELATAQQELDALRTERQRSRREIDEG